MNRDQVTFSILRTLAGKRLFQRPLNKLLAPFNPFDVRRHADPYPLYDRARSEGPIFYNRAAQAWVVTGYAEATEILRGSVSVDRRHTIESITPYNKMKPDNMDLLLSSMLMRDAPDHGRLRTLVNRAFTPRAITNMEPRIAELTTELIDELRSDESDRGTVDVMERLANRLPIYTIGELLGIPRKDRDELKALSDVVSQFVDPFTGFDPVEMDNAIDDLWAMFDTLASKRTSEPQDDLITALVQAEADGQRLDREELISMIILLLIAGHETTSGLIGNALVCLGRDLPSRRLLQTRPDLTRNAIEEFLRFDSPVQVTDRTVVEDFTVGGQTLQAGAIVLILFGAANRDPNRYENADELMLERLDPRPDLVRARCPPLCGCSPGQDGSSSDDPGLRQGLSRLSRRRTCVALEAFEHVPGAARTTGPADSSAPVGDRLRGSLDAVSLDGALPATLWRCRANPSHDRPPAAL